MALPPFYGIARNRPINPILRLPRKPPMGVGSPQKLAPSGPARTRVQSFSTAMELGRLFLASPSESAVALGAGATADLVCRKWLANHNAILGKQVLGTAVPYPSSARYKFGDGRIGEVEHESDIEVGNAGRRGAFTAFALDAEIPALLRKGALGALGAQLDFEKDTLSCWRVPLRVNAMGRYVVSVVELGRRPHVAASYFEWSFVEELPDLTDGGLHLPLVGSGLFRFSPPSEFSACTAVT